MFGMTSQIYNMQTCGSDADDDDNNDDQDGDGDDNGVCILRY